MSLTRRKFIALGSFSSTVALIGNSVQANPFLPQKQKNAPGFELLIMATNWGFDGDWEQFCAKIKKLGYDGAEAWYIHEAAGRKEFIEAFERHNLKYGLLIGGSDANPNKHFEQFKRSLDGAVAMKPVYINCHSGRDHFTFEQNKRFIVATSDATQRTGVPIYHETHRSRMLYSAPVAGHYIEAMPDLRLTLDISHWCNVHESLLADQPDTVALALDRADHIHARVGHPEGPQVNDPRAPEWDDAVKAHLGWWDAVAGRKKSEGKMLTILTEFGPPHYLPALPYTQQPVASQWEINVHMLEILRKRYA